MENPGKVIPSNSLVLACSFNNGKAADHSGKKHNGKIGNATAVEGKLPKPFTSQVSHRAKEDETLEASNTTGMKTFPVLSSFNGSS